MSTIKIIRKRMQDTQITTKQIARYIMQPEHVVKDWLRGKTVLAYMYVWKVCELLSIDPFEVLHNNVKKRYRS